MATEAQLPDNPSIADLRAALGQTTPATPAAESAKPAETPAAESAKPAEPTEPEAPKTEEPAKPAETPATPAAEKKGPPKRFSELTRENETLKQELERLRLAAQTPATPAAQRPAPASADEPIPDLPGKPAKPNADKFEGTYAEYEAAKEQYYEDLTEWKVKNVKHKETIEAQRAKAREAWQQVDRSWQEQYNAAMEADENFEAKVKQVAAVVAPKGIVEVIKESPVATQIVDALAADPAKLAKLGEMTPASAAREIGRIEASLQKPAAAPVKPLPNPPAVVGGSGEADTKPKPLGDIPFGKEFKEAVQKELGKTRVGLTTRRMTIR